MNKFKDIKSQLSLKFIFNPSFYCDEKIKIFTFRGISKKNDYNMSFLWIEDEKFHTVKNISMDLYSELGGTRLIDPKIAKIKDEYYVTFNSGWIEEGNNIFIMKVYPELESPKRIVYKNRQKQERNWAFFSEGNEIYALYRINPLKILKLTNTSDRTWQMEDYYSGQKQKDISTDLTIGTQLSKLDDKYYFVGHNKFYFRRKKIYLGKICTFSFNEKKVIPTKHLLAHSLKSIFTKGNVPHFSPYVFSVTYFSGLQAEQDSITIGYGVNDISCSFSTYKTDAFK